jgi:predicted SpoU family rRNA methylase
MKSRRSTRAMYTARCLTQQKMTASFSTRNRSRNHAYMYALQIRSVFEQLKWFEKEVKVIVNTQLHFT